MPDSCPLPYLPLFFFSCCWVQSLQKKQTARPARPVRLPVLKNARRLYLSDWFGGGWMIYRLISLRQAHRPGRPARWRAEKKSKQAKGCCAAAACSAAFFFRSLPAPSQDGPACEAGYASTLCRGFSPPLTIDCVYCGTERPRYERGERSSSAALWFAYLG